MNKSLSTLTGLYQLLKASTTNANLGVKTKHQIFVVDLKFLNQNRYLVVNQSKYPVEIKSEYETITIGNASSAVILGKPTVAKSQILKAVDNQLIVEKTNKELIFISNEISDLFFGQTDYLSNNENYMFEINLFDFIQLFPKHRQVCVNDSIKNSESKSWIWPHQTMLVDYTIKTNMPINMLVELIDKRLADKQDNEMPLIIKNKKYSLDTEYHYLKQYQKVFVNEKLELILKEAKELPRPTINHLDLETEVSK